jgi:hypothetical protein
VAQGEQGAHVFSFRFAHVQPFRARFDGLRKTDINHQFIIFACTPWSSQHPTMTSGSRTVRPRAVDRRRAPRGCHATPRGAALNSRYNQYE